MIFQQKYIFQGKRTSFGQNLSIVRNDGVTRTYTKSTFLVKIK